MNDILFKIVFGTEQSEPVLRPLLNALLGLMGENRIVQLQILNPFIGKSFADDRGVILDVRRESLWLTRL
jgi:hypothetical protein